MRYSPDSMTAIADLDAIVDAASTARKVALADILQRTCVAIATRRACARVAAEHPGLPKWRVLRLAIAAARAQCLPTPIDGIPLPPPPPPLGCRVWRNGKVVVLATPAPLPPPPTTPIPGGSHRAGAEGPNGQGPPSPQRDASVAAVSGKRRRWGEVDAVTRAAALPERLSPLARWKRERCKRDRRLAKLAEVVESQEG